MTEGARASTGSKTVSLLEYKDRKSASVPSPSGLNYNADVIPKVWSSQFTNIKMLASSTTMDRTLLDDWLKQKSCSIKSEKGDNMDWQERYFDKIDSDFSEIKDTIRATEERIASIVDRSMTEMRDRDNQRHNEFLDIRKEFTESRRWLIGIAISVCALIVATIIGIATIVSSIQ